MLCRSAAGSVPATGKHGREGRSLWLPFPTRYQSPAGSHAGQLLLAVLLLAGTSNANQVNITNILFGGGSPQGSPTYDSNASGTLGTSVQLNDIGVFSSAFTQDFAYGSTLSFDVNLPNVSVDPTQPDNFTIGLFDGSNTTTNGPDGFQLASIDFTNTHPTIGDVQTYGYTANGTTYTAQVSAQDNGVGAAPEPAFYQMGALLGCGAIAMCLSRRRKSGQVIGRG